MAEDEGFDEVFRSHALNRPRPLSSLDEVVGAARLDGGAAPEAEDDLPVLRTRRRVPPKRGLLPSGRLGRILVFLVALAVVAAMVAAGVAIHSFFMQDARFRIDAASSIQVIGNSEVTRPELLSVFGGDIGRNIFHVPLTGRRAELEQLPWVEHATVMRLLPNQLRVAVTERTPVAFVRSGSRIGLVDAHGVLLDMPAAMMAAKHYSFPVVNGVTAGQSAEDRAARMQLYEQFMGALGAAGDAARSALGQVSEVDLSDPEDVRVLLPSAGTDLLVHFGSDDFAGRWQRLEQKLPVWRQQYPRLAGVDLRYQRQTVLEMAKAAADDPTTEPAAAPAAGKTSARPAVHTAARISPARTNSSRPSSVRKQAVATPPTTRTAPKTAAPRAASPRTRAVPEVRQ